MIFWLSLTNAMHETSSPVNSLLTAALIVFGKCQCLGDGKIDIHRLAAVSRFLNEQEQRHKKMWKRNLRQIFDVL